MNIVIALIRKNLRDVRWMLLLIGVALFWFCWLFVFIPHQIQKGIGNGRPIPPGMSVSTIELEMRFWDNNPLILLLLGLWAISRGTALAGEIEKGTIDLIMSRPVRRTTYLFTQVLVSTLGLVVIVGSMLAGNLSSAHFNPLLDPPSLEMLLKPALNLFAFGWSVYGYTFLVSSIDIVRWRPIMIGSVATLGGFIAHVVSTAPRIPEGYKWMDRLSIFRACKLVEVATTGETLVYNVSILGGIGLIGVVVGFAIFAYRDLPASS